MKNFEIKDLLNLKAWECECKSKKEYLELYLRGRSPMTYYKSGRRQCPSGRNRSFIELHYLLKAKFKTTTREETAGILYNLCRYSNNEIRMLYCCDIHEVVFFSNELHGYDSFIDKNGLVRFDFNKNRSRYGFTVGTFVKMAERYNVKKALKK